MFIYFQTESPLVIKPYLNKLTTSELHAIMCSGFATVSGEQTIDIIYFVPFPPERFKSTHKSRNGSGCVY